MLYSLAAQHCSSAEQPGCYNGVLSVAASVAIHMPDVTLWELADLTEDVMCILEQ